MRFSLSLIFILSLFSLIYKTNSFVYTGYSHDGKYNNILHHNLGSTGRTFKYSKLEYYPWAHQDLTNLSLTYGTPKSLWPDYGPRGNPRTISNLVGTRHEIINDLEFGNNLLFVIFGQFINHDLEISKDGPYDIVNFPLATVVEDDHDWLCLPTTDRAFPHDYRCNETDPLLLIRQKMSIDHNGEHDYPEFKAINLATSFFDLDQVYGRDDSTNKKLRSGKGGKLKVTKEVTFEFGFTPATKYNYTFRNVLPTVKDTGVPADIVYHFLGTNDTHFSAGDKRVNQNMALTLFHTLFVREHNRLTDQIMKDDLLYRLFPSIFDNQIYYLARKMNIAQYQKIIYKEFLPRLLGSVFETEFPKFTGYKIIENPTVSIEFATTAMRYGHFLMQNFWSLDEEGRVINSNQIDPMERKVIYVGTQNPLPIDMTPFGRYASAGGFENTIRGLINQEATENLLTVENDLRNLSANWGGVDLLVFDIMRNRQVSVGNYISLRHSWTGRNLTQECEAEEEDSLECFKLISNRYAEELKELYGHPKYVDGVVGLQSEDKIPGTMFGHTSLKIFIDQFQRTRDGDRLFYENYPPLAASVANISIGELFERNFDIILPEEVFGVFKYKQD